MDDYIEQVIKRKRTFADMLPFTLSYLIALAGIAVFAAVSISFGALIVAVGGFLGSFSSKRLHSQFEYIFTNGDFDSAIIYNMAKRKEFFPLMQTMLQGFFHMKATSLKMSLTLTNPLS